MFRRPNRHAPAADARGDDRGRAVPNLAQTVVETRMMRDPRDEPEGEYLPRVGVSREDQRVAVARRLVVIDRLVIDEDSRGRSRRLARQFREALTAPPRVFAPHEGQGAVDDARFVEGNPQGFCGSSIRLSVLLPHPWPPQRAYPYLHLSKAYRIDVPIPVLFSLLLLFP